MFAEGSRLLGMASEARSIADVADIGMNVAIRTCVDKPRVNTRRFRGFERRSRLLPPAMPQAGKNAATSQQDENKNADPERFPDFASASLLKKCCFRSSFRRGG